MKKMLLISLMAMSTMAMADNPFSPQPSQLPVPPSPGMMPTQMPTVSTADSESVRTLDVMSVIAIYGDYATLRFQNAAQQANQNGFGGTRTLQVKNGEWFYTNGKKFKLVIAGLTVKVQDETKRIIFYGDIESPAVTINHVTGAAGGGAAQSSTTR